MTITSNKARRVFDRLKRLVVRRKPDRKQVEINRLRKVLHEIVDTRPDEHMDIEKTPELTEWICDTCIKAHIGAYPRNATHEAQSKTKGEL